MQQVAVLEGVDLDTVEVVDIVCQIDFQKPIKPQVNLLLTAIERACMFDMQAETIINFPGMGSVAALLSAWLGQILIRPNKMLIIRSAQAGGFEVSEIVTLRQDKDAVQAQWETEFD
jgi:hypothetical protein